MRIGHYMRNMFEPGGIASYIRRISTAQRAVGHDVYFFDRLGPLSPDPQLLMTRDDADLFQQAARLNLDLLHLHCAVESVNDATPLLRTLHTHSPYCPSQGRFLKTPGKPCDRTYSLLGCLWGHAANRCGSIRPVALTRNFQTVRHEMATLPRIKTIVVSQFLKSQMIRAGYPASQIEVLYLPAPDQLSPSPVPDTPIPTFLYLGRMIPHKGVDWLLRAMTKTTAPMRLLLAGTGNQENEYRALATSLALGDRARFLGWQEPAAVTNLLRECRGLVFPSIWHEPGGTVAFEAMSHARPVIMSRVGGMPEVVTDNQTGLLVEPGDQPALAAAMDRLASDHVLASRLGDAGHVTIASHFTLPQHMNRLMQLYHQAIHADVQTSGAIEPVVQ